MKDLKVIKPYRKIDVNVCMTVEVPTSINDCEANKNITDQLWDAVVNSTITSINFERRWDNDNE